MQRVILGQLVDARAAAEVHARVAELPDYGDVANDERHGCRRPHALEPLIGARQVADRQRRALDRIAHEHTGTGDRRRVPRRAGHRGLALDPLLDRQGQRRRDPRRPPADPVAHDEQPERRVDRERVLVVPSLTAGIGGDRMSRS